MDPSLPEAPALPSISPPSDAPVEVVRMRRQVHAGLFGGTPEPTRIGRFRLMSCIGRGGMGVVWSAHDDELDRTVAIKLLRPELSGHDLSAEARALARLSHPNVVSVFDVGLHEAQQFIAMEFVDGATLRSWLATPRSESEIVSMFVQAGMGLAAAHGVGLVHRDFKPDNVLVGGDGRPRVLDFGLARAADRGLDRPPALPPDASPFATTMTVGGLLIGTPAYMAPEQHLGDPADARSDQFAFAVALFEGLTGTLPFVGEDLRTLSLAIVRGRITEPAQGVVSPPVLRVIARALSVDPQARFETVDAFLAALRQSVPGHDARFDTRQVERVLDRAAELEAASPSRPGTSAAELEQIAAEAGIDPRHARQAAHEALAAPPVPVPVAAPQLPAVPADEDRGFAMEISVRQPCVRVGATAIAILIREMERRHGKGKTEQLGASTTWQGRGLEVHIDPTATGSMLTLRRRLGALARSRPYRYGALGVIVAVATIVPIAEGMNRFGDAIVVFVFGAIFLGAFLGRRFARWVHRRALAGHRDALRGDASRLAAIAHAQLL